MDDFSSPVPLALSKEAALTSTSLDVFFSCIALRVDIYFLNTLHDFIIFGDLFLRIFIPQIFVNFHDLPTYLCEFARFLNFEKKSRPAHIATEIYKRQHSARCRLFVPVDICIIRNSHVYGLETN